MAYPLKPLQALSAFLATPLALGTSEPGSRTEALPFGPGGNRTSRRVIGSVTALVALVAASATLFFLPPVNSTIYPLCPFHQATGLLCPGCGATRALAALLHGRWHEAFHQNALVVLLLPGMAAYGIVALLRARNEHRLVWPTIPRAAVALLVGVACTFALLRNLP